MGDVQERYRTVARGFSAAVEAAARSGAWEAPSPCEDWTAGDVVRHVVGAHRRLIAGVRGEEPAALGAEEDPRQAWEEASAAVEEIAGDTESLAREIDGPVGLMSVGELIDRFVDMDTLVHTWDLARAVGADERLDEATVVRTYAVLEPMDAMIRLPGVFGPKLEPPPGADRQTELIYFLGRRA